MIVTKCIITLATHVAHIQVDIHGQIQVFKYTNHCCDFEVFTSKQQLDASDYIITPLPTSYYSVTFPEDQERLLK
jgi:hypothetical protein